MLTQSTNLIHISLVLLVCVYMHLMLYNFITFVGLYPPP